MTEFKYSVASPCNQDWASMSGDERKRFCGSCKKNVFNFKEMSNVEIETLIQKTEGKVCVRLYTRKDGTVLTRDCPVGLAGIRRRMVAGLAMCGAVLLGAFALFPRNRVSTMPTLKARAVRIEDQLRSVKYVGAVIEYVDPKPMMMLGEMEPGP